MIIDLLGELACAEVGLIEQLESDAAGFRQTGGRHFDAQLGDAPGGDENGGAIVFEAILGARFAQLGEHRTGVLGGYVGEQRLEIALLIPVGERGESRPITASGGCDPDALGDRMLANSLLS